ncbi:MAG: DUF349 domain-containing protein [Proteobacteria bacterium]|jgi:DNA repair protein SbcC/Rad50|nr:DUF349 domain-containing protein [Pseudomonadota bacterium]
MLSDLLKPGWQSQSVEKRLQAIDKLDTLDEANQSIFESLANDDSKASVRKAALTKLTQPGPVFKISQAHSDVATRNHADTVLSELIGAKSGLSETGFRALVATHPKMTSSIIQFCPHADLRAELIQTRSEPEKAALIADVEYSETRTLIAQQLTSAEQLEIARKLLKGKDKNAEKIIKSKLDVLHADQRQKQENIEAAERLCECVEYLASHTKEWRAEFKSRYMAASQQWGSLSFVPDKDVRQRYQKADAKVRGEMELQDKIEATYRAQQQLAQQLEIDCNALAKLSLQQLVEEKPSFAKKLDAGLSQWASHSEVAAPDRTNLRQFLLAQKTLASVVTFCTAIAKPGKGKDVADTVEIKSAITVLKNSIAGLHWPKQYPAMVAKAEAIAQLGELKAQTIKTQSAEKVKLDKLHKRINRLLGSTNRGELSRAKRELAAATKAASRYKGKERKALDERLEKAADAVNKMGDWKDFATEPKYLELCEAMEVLTISKAHADKLSVEINKLQKRWKALGHSDSADQHWVRFKVAGDKAYEPCAVFFKQRHAARRENLKKREPYLQQTRELLENTDWDASPDYKEVEAELRRISSDWQKIKDVEQGVGQKQWNKLSKIRTAIYEKLDVVYDRNIEAKNLLIEQAQALFETDVKEDSFDKLKLLQSRWKQVGITRRKEDQVAWKRFKSATDNFFEKIQGIRKAKRADEDAQLQGYRQISQQIQELAKIATDLAEADTTFDRLQAEYKELPELPRGLPEKLIKGIESDFQRASDAFGKARDRIKKAGRSAALDALAKKAALCADLEKLAADAPAKKIEQVQNALATIEIDNRSLNQRFEKRLVAALDPDSDREEASLVRQLLCIDLEILLGVDSPAEDAELRMKIQLERLKKGGLGRGQAKKDDGLNELKLDWLCLPGAQPEIQQALDKRFARLVAKRS